MAQRIRQENVKIVNVKIGVIVNVKIGVINKFEYLKQNQTTENRCKYLYHSLPFHYFISQWITE